MHRTFHQIINLTPVGGTWKVTSPNIRGTSLTNPLHVFCLGKSEPGCPYIIMDLISETCCCCTSKQFEIHSSGICWAATTSWRWRSRRRSPPRRSQSSSSGPPGAPCSQSTSPTRPRRETLSLSIINFISQHIYWTFITIVKAVNVVDIPKFYASRFYRREIEFHDEYWSLNPSPFFDGSDLNLKQALVNHKKLKI